MLVGYNLTAWCISCTSRLTLVYLYSIQRRPRQESKFPEFSNFLHHAIVYLSTQMCSTVKCILTVNGRFVIPTRGWKAGNKYTKPHHLAFCLFKADLSIYDLVRV